jgi:hypothetical protein
MSWPGVTEHAEFPLSTHCLLADACGKMLFAATNPTARLLSFI